VSAIAAWNNWVGAVRQAIQKDIEGAHFVIAALALQAGGSIELPPGILAKIEKRGRLATNNRIGGGFTITYIPPTEAGGAE